YIPIMLSFFVLFNHPYHSYIYTLSLHDALPIFIILIMSAWWIKSYSKQKPLFMLMKKLFQDLKEMKYFSRNVRNFMKTYMKKWDAEKKVSRLCKEWSNVQKKWGTKQLLLQSPPYHLRFLDLM